MIDFFALIHTAQLSTNEKLEIVKKTVASLPAAHQPLLSYLMRFLHSVASRSAHNRMDANNLAIVIGPNILRSSDEKEDVDTMVQFPRGAGAGASTCSSSFAIVAFMIESAHLIWPTNDSKSSNYLRCCAPAATRRSRSVATLAPARPWQQALLQRTQELQRLCQKRLQQLQYVIRNSSDNTDVSARYEQAVKQEEDANAQLCLAIEELANSYGNNQVVETETTATKCSFVRALYAFAGIETDSKAQQLMFSPGDTIQVLENGQNGWSKGQLGHTSGWFPSSFVETITASTNSHANDQTFPSPPPPPGA